MIIWVAHQEENNLSDLTNSCEYLTSEKLCLAVSESEKAKAARQLRCKNDEKTTCCYLCMFVMDCATSCRFLGNIGNEPQQINSEKIKTDDTFASDEKLEDNKTESATATCCTLCNVEMSQTRTKLRISGWEEPNQKLADDGSEKLDEDFLPLIVYLCPKCGKIEFRTDEKLKKN